MWHRGMQGCEWVMWHYSIICRVLLPNPLPPPVTQPVCRRRSRSILSHVRKEKKIMLHVTFSKKHTTCHIFFVRNFCRQKENMKCNMDSFSYYMSHFYRKILHVTFFFWQKLLSKKKHTACHTYEFVMSHMWMRHVTHMKESCHTYEWVMSHI